MVSAAPSDSNKGAYMLANPEEFRLVPDLDKPYYVSNYGRVAVEENGHRRQLTLQSDGRYAYVRLGGRVHKVSVSYMVARAFVNNLCLRQYVRHKDADSSNNCAGNLEWCEFQEVIKVDPKGGKVQRTKGVLQYTKDGELVRRWNSVSEASRNTDLQRGRILEVIKGKRNSAGGYVWRFELC